jgi:hypothetical protein
MILKNLLQTGLKENISNTIFSIFYRWCSCTAAVQKMYIKTYFLNIRLGFEKKTCAVKFDFTGREGGRGGGGAGSVHKMIVTRAL